MTKKDTTNENQNKKPAETAMAPVAAPIEEGPSGSWVAAILVGLIVLIVAVEMLRS
jgi:hypothetical protein